jgi:hypothetical protein
LEQDIGERGEISMKKREIRYTSEDMGQIKIVEDFLPSPDQLIVKEETVKITIALTRDSVDFFKEAAKKQHTHYQTMIRSLLDQYTAHFRNI